MWNIFAKEDGFPYRVQERGRQLDFSFCSLHDGTHKTRGGEYSVFKTATNSPQKSQYSHLNLQRLKTLRHPNVLSFVHHSEEDPNFGYVVTEKATPLLEYLGEMTCLEIKNDYIAWGIMKILKALIFCHESAKMLHNNVGSNAVFVDRAGEWKLAEFGVSDESYSGPMSGTRAEQYHNWIKNNTKVTWELDTYGLAVLAIEAYEGKIHSARSVPEPTDKVPKPFRDAMQTIFNGEKIPTLQQLLENGTATNAFRNNFIDQITFLEEIHLKTHEERREFYKVFHNYLKHLPNDLRKFKIFPMIMLSYDYGCEGSELLPSVLEFCKIEDPEMNVVPMIGRLYNSPSRKTRKALLESMREYIGVLAPSVVNDTIYPMWEVGLQDGSEKIRLETLKSTECLVPLLNHQRINRNLLPRLVSRLVDEERGEIREMVLKKVLAIAKKHAESEVKKQLILTVITKVLKDEHPRAKSAAIDSTVELQDHFTQHEIATKLLPPLCPLTIDSSVEVRFSAIRAMRALLDKTEKSKPEESTLENPKRTSSWTEWAKTNISTRITSIFLEDESPKHASTLDSTKCKNESRNMPLIDANVHKTEAADKLEANTTSTTEQKDDDSEFVYNDRNQNWEWTEDKPNELTNNEKELRIEDGNKTQRKVKKLKGPRKLGTRINQRN